MKVAERRKEIVTLLMSEREAISGGALAEHFHISRQIIVQDISVLKSLGYEIISTHNGYVLQKSPLLERVFKVKHTTEQTEDELKERLTSEDWELFTKYQDAERGAGVISDADIFIEGFRMGALIVMDVLLKTA